MLVQGERVRTQNSGFSSLHDSLSLCVKYSACAYVCACRGWGDRESEKMCMCACTVSVCVCVCFLPHCSGIPVEKVV